MKRPTIIATGQEGQPLRAYVSQPPGCLARTWATTKLWAVRVIVGVLLFGAGYGCRGIVE